MKNGIMQTDYEGLRALMGEFPENADVFKRLAFLWDDSARHETHFLGLSGSKIVAAGSVKENPYDKSELWLMHISVDPEYKGHGYGKRILSSIFDHAVKSGHILAPSTFEDEGFICLAHVMERLHQEHPTLKMHYSRAIPDEIIDGSRPYTLLRPYGYGSLQIQKK